jgi:hypothetical protein
MGDESLSSASNADYQLYSPRHSKFRTIELASLVLRFVASTFKLWVFVCYLAFASCIARRLSFFYTHVWMDIKDGALLTPAKLRRICKHTMHSRCVASLDCPWLDTELSSSTVIFSRLSTLALRTTSRIYNQTHSRWMRAQNEHRSDLVSAPSELEATPPRFTETFAVKICGDDLGPKLQNGPSWRAWRSLALSGM